MRILNSASNSVKMRRQRLALVFAVVVAVLCPDCFGTPLPNKRRVHTGFRPAVHATSSNNISSATAAPPDLAPRWCATQTAQLDLIEWFGNFLPKGIARDELGNVYVHSDNFIARATSDIITGDFSVTQVNADPLNSVNVVFSAAGYDVIGDVEVWDAAPGGACLIFPVSVSVGDKNNLNGRRKKGDVVSDDQFGAYRNSTEFKRPPVLLVLVRAITLQVVKIVQLRGTSFESLKKPVLVLDVRGESVIVVEWTAVGNSKLLVYALSDIAREPNGTDTSAGAGNNENREGLKRKEDDDDDDDDDDEEQQQQQQGDEKTTQKKQQQQNDDDGDDDVMNNYRTAEIFPKRIIQVGGTSNESRRQHTAVLLGIPAGLVPRGGTITDKNELVLIHTYEQTQDSTTTGDETDVNNVDDSQNFAMNIQQALVVVDRESGVVIRWQETFLGSDLQGIAAEPGGGLILLAGASGDKSARLIQLSLCRLAAANVPSITETPPTRSPTTEGSVFIAAVGEKNPNKRGNGDRLSNKNTNGNSLNGAGDENAALNGEGSKPASNVAMITMMGLVLTVMSCVCLLVGQPSASRRTDQSRSDKYQHINIYNLPVREEYSN